MFNDLGVFSGARLYLLYKLGLNSLFRIAIQYEIVKVVRVLCLFVFRVGQCLKQRFFCSD